MLILTKQDMQQLFTMQDAIAASKQALSYYSDKQATVPLRTSVAVPDVGQSLFMPAFVTGLETYGIKIVSIFPNNLALGKPSVPAKMLLIDSKTGEVCALMDGTYLTQLRTGALQGVATDLLARKDAKFAVLIGTGGQASTQLDAMLQVRKLTEIKVYDVDAKRAATFVAQKRLDFPNSQTNIIATDDLNTAIANADIITTITTAKTPVFDGNLIKNGVHINGIGAYLPDMQELPASVISAAHKLIFDTNEGVLAEAGDILIPLQAGTISSANFTGELGELILGRITGRENADQITVFKAVGSAVLDIVTAAAIYQKARAANVGQHINL